MRPNLVPTISQQGERLDLEVRQGSTLGPIRHTVTDVDNVTPFNFTGCTVLGSIRKTPRAFGEPAATLVVVFPFDRTLGYYDFSVPDEITATMPMDADVTKFYWDSELIDASGRVIPLFYGEFRVTAEATREDTVAPVVDDTTCCG